MMKPRDPEAEFNYHFRRAQALAAAGEKQNMVWKQGRARPAGGAWPFRDHRTLAQISRDRALLGINP